MNIREEFQQLLMSIKTNKKFSEDEFIREIKPILNFVNNNLPKTLYKFRTFNKKTLNAFEMGEIWLSNAKQFNDVHDTLTYVNRSLIDDQLSNIINEFMKGNNNLEQYQMIIEKICINDKELKNICLDGINKMNQIFPNKLNSTLVESLISSIIDFGLAEFQELYKTRIKMACLTESINSPLMWAHYADFHKGFALGYNFENNSISKCSNCIDLNCDERINSNIFPIIYSDNRFDVTEYAKWYIEQSVCKGLGLHSEDEYSDKLIHYKIALQKSKDWDYEKEWRIIASTSNKIYQNVDYYSIKKKPISLYLGCKMPKEQKDKVIKIARRKGIEIPVYQMFVKNHSDKYEIDSELLC